MSLSIAEIESLQARVEELEGDNRRQEESIITYQSMLYKLEQELAEVKQAIKAGRTRPWSEVRKEMEEDGWEVMETTVPYQPETQTVCPCYTASLAPTRIPWESVCQQCWNASYYPLNSSPGPWTHSSDCTTPNCSGTLTPEETE